MKKHHTTFVLLVLFFTGLIVVWWTDYAGLPTREEVEEQHRHVLPALLKVAPADIRRVEIVRATDRLAFERRGRGRWQMVAPVDALADPARVETLVRNLAGLRKSTAAGTIHDPAASFGLDHPAATVRLFGNGKEPLAALDFGKTVRALLYVRPSGSDGIEVIDPKLIPQLDAPATAWRERALFSISSFEAAGLTLSGPGRDVQVERSESHWKLVRPLHAPADDEKVEGVVAGLAALRVVEGDRGFVADDVKDFKPFGLDKDAAETIDLQAAGRTNPRREVLLVGKPAPEGEGHFYARREDQDDVVLIDGKELRDLGTDPNGLRSHKVADLDPDRVASLRVEALGEVFELARTMAGWELVRPDRAKADPVAVRALLARLADLQTSEFLRADRVAEPRLDPPGVMLRAWQAAPRSHFPAAPATAPEGTPALVLRLGRHDAIKKSIYARVEDDPTGTVLVLPDNVLEVLPTNALAYRDRTVATVDPARVARLVIERDGRAYAVEPDTKADLPNQWSMVAPVSAPADNEAVTNALIVLKELRAQGLVTDQPDDKAYGLDAPTLRVTWTTRPEPDDSKGSTEPATETLRVGSRAPDPKVELYYARLAGGPRVFTLPASVLAPFRAELRGRLVLRFPARQAERLILRWPGRTLSFAHRASPPVHWEPEPGVDATGFDLSRLDPLVSDLSKLTTARFLQYDGPIPASEGLARPRLTVEIHLSGNAGTPTLRVGRPRDDGTMAATTDPGDSGAVFVLSGPAWASLVQFGGVRGELPEDVFAPVPDR